MSHPNTQTIEDKSSEVRNFLCVVTQGYELKFSQKSFSMRTRTNRLRTPIRDTHKILDVSYLGRNRPELRHKWRVQKSLLQNVRVVSLSASVCANLFFATMRLRLLGLEPPASRFFVSHAGRFCMPTLASPRFELLLRCRPFKHAFPFRLNCCHE